MHAIFVAFGPGLTGSTEWYSNMPAIQQKSLVINIEASMSS